MSPTLGSASSSDDQCSGRSAGCRRVQEGPLMIVGTAMQTGEG